MEELCSSRPNTLTPTSAGTQLETLERRAGLVTEYELERRKLEVLGRLSDQYAALGPQLKDMGLYIAELKQYLQVSEHRGGGMRPVRMQLLRG